MDRNGACVPADCILNIADEDQLRVWVVHYLWGEEGLAGICCSRIRRVVPDKPGGS